MLITNKQAIICAAAFGSMLRKGGVMTNIYELCDVDLKDFSIQGRFMLRCLLYNPFFLCIVYSLILSELFSFCFVMCSGGGEAYGQQGLLLFS